MTRTTLLILATTLSSILAAQYNAQNLSPMVDESIAEQFRCDKLRLYPIMANSVFQEAHKDVEKSVPMGEALEDGRLAVNELEGGGTVNTLKATNNSSDTIYLMQGQVVVGGKQDRMLAQDVLIPPGASMNIGAFCVEHGRWSAGGDGASFTKVAGVVAQDVRKAAAVEKEQQEVWDRVAHNVNANKAKTSTGSYVDLTTDKDHVQRMDAYRTKLKDMPASCNGIVGVIAVSGDKVVGCDVFATEAMFTKAYPQLIDAYITEALTNGSKVTMTNAELQEYFTALFAEEDKLQKKTDSNGYMFKKDGKTYRMSMF